MDIVIISEFCEDFSRSDNDRFLYLARMLAEKHQVEIVTSTFRHTAKKHRKRPATDWPFQITFIDEPGYPRNICIQRFRSHYVWGKNVGKYLDSRKKPDVVYCAVPSLTGPNLVAKYCEKNHIRFVIDVQDLWPEAFQLVLNIPIVSRIAFAPFSSLADGIYRRADAVCAVSDTYTQRALKASSRSKKGTTVFLGTQLSVFDHFAEENLVQREENGEIWLAYCGTLGSSYDLTCVIDALAMLRDRRLRFVVMGDGPRMEEFQKYASDKGVCADFYGRMPYNEMCGLLKSCDITVNPIGHHAAQSIINKHADYAASGLPVVSTQECVEYRDLVDKYQMGFNCANGAPDELAEKIRLLADDPVLRRTMGNNARRCAETLFDRSVTYQALYQTITST